MDSVYLTSALVAIDGAAVEGERLEITASHPDLSILHLSPTLLQIVALNDQTHLSTFESVLRTTTYVYTSQM